MLLSNLIAPLTKVQMGEVYAKKHPGFSECCRLQHEIGILQTMRLRQTVEFMQARRKSNA